MPRVLLLLPFVSLFACASAGGLPPSAIAHNEAGARLLEGGELDDAEARFRLALEYHPGFAESRANLGLVAFRRGKLDEAEEQLRAAIRLDRSFDEAWSNLGLVLVAQDRHAAAGRAFEQALSIDPGLVPARRNLAELRMRGGDYIGARAHLMRLVQIVSEDTEEGMWAAGLLAYCEFRLGRHQAAAFRAETVLIRSPDAPFARLVRGVMRAQAGQIEEAFDDMNVARMEPSLRRDADVRRAALHLVAGEVDEADCLLAELLAEDPSDPAAHLVAGYLSLSVEDRAGARLHAQAALQVVPGLQEAQALLERSELDR